MSWLIGRRRIIMDGRAWFFAMMVCAIAAPPAVTSAARSRIVLREGWQIKQLEPGTANVAELGREATAGADGWLEARMPAQVHDVLLQHGKISDPRVGKNAADSAWVGDRDWAYACTFPSPPRRGGPAFLCFDGLDTLAEVYVNGTRVGTFNNMYRSYRVDVTARLAEEGDRNTLLVIFRSPLRYVANVQVPENMKGVSPSHFLRKCHSDFGSYLGARPHSAKVGIFRDVYLDLPDRSWIADVWVRPQLRDDLHDATVDVHVETEGEEATVGASLYDPAGQRIGSSHSNSPVRAARFTFHVPSPQLWWPRTHGDQPLYRVEVTVGKGGQLDSRRIEFGIRSVRTVLEDPETGEPRFRFDVNGRPIFMRGADLAPIEGMSHCWDEQRAAKLLDLMELGRMNVLRIWAEGNIPPQSFYAECDRRGIFIWQDFMFGYGMHPSGLAEFDENCRVEIEAMIRSLRNHPCLLLWVGGNENHMGWDFRYGTRPAVGTRLFTEIMPDAVRRLDPDRHFHPSSPYGGRVPNWPLEGDWHDYSTLKYCPHASVPAYASEVGRVSAPSLTSMRRFLSGEDLWPEGHDPAITAPGKAAWPPMWQYRSVGGSWDKVGTLEQYCDPRSANDLIRVLGTAHGDYLRDRVERERRGVPDGKPDGNRRCWGNMVWRLNDSWPIIYWSIIDYHLEPKIAYYYLRRAYDPVLVTFEQGADEIYAWVVNDSPAPIEGTLTVTRQSFTGSTLGELKTRVFLAPGKSKRYFALTELGPIVKRKEFLRAELAGQTVTQLLIAERYLHLPHAKLSVRRTDEGVEISTDVFARQVTLATPDVTGAIFDDNFFDMAPGQTRQVRLVDSNNAPVLTVGALNADLVELSLQ